MYRELPSLNALRTFEYEDVDTVDGNGVEGANPDAGQQFDSYEPAMHAAMPPPRPH